MSKMAEKLQKLPIPPAAAINESEKAVLNAINDYCQQQVSIRCEPIERNLAKFSSDVNKRIEDLEKKIAELPKKCENCVVMKNCEIEQLKSAMEDIKVNESSHRNVKCLRNS